MCMYHTVIWWYITSVPKNRSGLVFHQMFQKQNQDWWYEVICCSLTVRALVDHQIWWLLWSYTHDDYIADPDCSPRKDFDDYATLGKIDPKTATSSPCRRFRVNLTWLSLTRKRRLAHLTSALQTFTLPCLAKLLRMSLQKFRFDFST
jgi:hypothetical protein